MNKKTAEALEGSIDKWQKIVDYLRYKQKVDWDVLNKLEQGGGNCPLCQLSDDCYDCPVMEETGHYDCRTTPYYNFCKSVDNEDTKEMRKHAKRELEFLKSLREQNGN